MPPPLWHSHDAIVMYYWLREHEQPVITPYRNASRPPYGGLVAQEGDFISQELGFQQNKKFHRLFRD